ncbi:MAG TPA: Hpt domain-containing protein, partial [Anaeromyxobacteraceae bacterium]|nr:Hpt domain-containing protein [Anaeromyxobacteraceae bacterium]
MADAAHVNAAAVAALLEELAVAVMSADAADEAAVARLAALLDALAGTGHPAVAAAAGAASAIREASFDVRQLAAALDAASEVVAAMQEAVARGGAATRAPAPDPSDPGALRLPEWGDERTLKDFLAAQQGSLEELEQAILGMEGGDPERRAAFKRRLHTTKGEAGVLGLEDLERVCHATEDFLEAHGVSAEITDRLLRVRDWMAKALDAYARMRLPEPRAAGVIGEVLVGPSAASSAIADEVVHPERSDATASRSRRAPSPSSSSSSSSIPIPTPASTPSTPPEPSEPGKVVRDAETVGLFGEFLGESNEGLNRVDQILMNVERDGVDGDTVNSLFRVFHVHQDLV